MARTPQKQQINVLLDEADEAMLRGLAETTGETNSNAIRHAIRSAFAMAVSKTPTCADGQSCRCPQFHMYGLPPQPQHPGVPTP